MSYRFFAVTAFGVLCACGAGPRLSVTVQPLSGGVDYNIWLFGAAVTCTGNAANAAGRTALEAAPACGGDAGADTSVCYLQLDKVTLNSASRFDDVPPGPHALFGVERDSNQNAIGWACAQVTVSAGSPSAATLTFQAN